MLRPKPQTLSVSHVCPPQWAPTTSARTISAETHHQNIDFNIYEGMNVTGLAAATIAQGKVVYQNGELKSERGAGRHINRPCWPTYAEATRRVRKLAEPTAVIRG